MEKRRGKCVKVGAAIGQMVSQMGADSKAARINLRVQQVRERYRQAIESVYPKATAELHLAHTNKVIIKDVRETGRNGEPRAVRTLIVYVDDSLFAAELNAQRELIKLRLLELFDEDVENFDIRVSGRREYRSEHPYLNDDSQDPDRNTLSLPLDADEKLLVSNTASQIEDKRIRKALEKAMTADLEWKKGENVDRERKSTK